MSSPRATLLMICALPFCAIALQKNIQHVPTHSTRWASGEEMYIHYCASCHGKDGHGGGPVAPALKVAPTDLTALAKNNKGVFPRARVRMSIQGDLNIPAHGSREMPVWGEVFLSMSMGQPGLVHQRLHNLTHYVEAMQQK